MPRDRALVTGASSGIGATYADRLARRDLDLVLVARDRPRLMVLAERLTQDFGVQVEVHSADLTESTELAQVELRLRNDESISMLVNNAGMAASGSFVAADPALIESLVRLNVVAVTRLAAAIAPRLARQGRGTIVNLSSVTALAPEAFEPVYPATKAFVLSFSQALERELGPLGVRIQAVLPGVTRTEIWERSGNDLEALPPEMVMEVDELVDAALAGLDRGETVTIPSLPDMADWEAYTQARLRLRPNLSRRHPARRYGAPGPGAA